MRTWFALLFFLTIGMRPFGWSVEPLKVTEVRHGLVTMVGEDSVYQIEAAEAWQVGDRALALVSRGKIVEVRWVR